MLRTYKSLCNQRLSMVRAEISLLDQQNLERLFKEREQHQQAYDKQHMAEALQMNNDRLRTTIVE